MFCLSGKRLVQKVLFLLLEAKYLELLEAGSTLEAVQCLRQELTPLKLDTNRVHQLSRSAKGLQAVGWLSCPTSNLSACLFVSMPCAFFPFSVLCPFPLQFTFVFYLLIGSGSCARLPCLVSRHIFSCSCRCCLVLPSVGQFVFGWSYSLPLCLQLHDVCIS